MCKEQRLEGEELGEIFAKERQVGRKWRVCRIGILSKANGSFRLEVVRILR